MSLLPEYFGSSKQHIDIIIINMLDLKDIFSLIKVNKYYNSLLNDKRLISLTQIKCYKSYALDIGFHYGCDRIIKLELLENDNDNENKLIDTNSKQNYERMHILNKLNKNVNEKKLSNVMITNNIGLNKFFEYLSDNACNKYKYFKWNIIENISAKLKISDSRMMYNFLKYISDKNNQIAFHEKYHILSKFDHRKIIKTCCRDDNVTAFKLVYECAMDGAFPFILLKYDYDDIRLLYCIVAYYKSEKIYNYLKSANKDIHTEYDTFNFAGDGYISYISSFIIRKHYDPVKALDELKTSITKLTKTRVIDVKKQCKCDHNKLYNNFSEFLKQDHFYD